MSTAVNFSTIVELIVADTGGQPALAKTKKASGTARNKASVLSFVVDGIHPHDIGTVLDREGVAVRTGHHCAQPVMERFGVPAIARASFGLYNTAEEIEVFARGIRKSIEVLG